MIVFGNLLLLAALFVSANMALAWGELASYDLAGDKSGLAGLGGALVFMVLRWTTVAAVLWIGIKRSGFGWLPGGPRIQTVTVLLAHTALGVLSYRAFEWLVDAIQRGDPGPLRFGWIFGVALPLVVFLVALVGLNRDWIPRRPIVAAILAAAIIWGHLAGWREGYRQPAASPPAPSPAAS